MFRQIHGVGPTPALGFLRGGSNAPGGAAGDSFPRSLKHHRLVAPLKDVKTQGGSWTTVNG
jgi:hypothetical protein